MAEVNFNMQVVNDEYERLGKMAKDEYYVAICFAIAMVNVVIVAQVVTPLYGECVDCNEKNDATVQFNGLCKTRRVVILVALRWESGRIG